MTEFVFLICYCHASFFKNSLALLIVRYCPSFWWHKICFNVVFPTIIASQWFSASKCQCEHFAEANFLQYFFFNSRVWHFLPYMWMNLYMTLTDMCILYEKLPYWQLHGCVPRWDLQVLNLTALNIQNLRLWIVKAF